MADDQRQTTTKARRGTAAEVFGVFLKLGLTSFGGPVAHLGYFRDELVTRRRWLSDPDYADLMALCQFLPGPASSQLGFALGLMRAGWPGAFAAFLGFTLPSALVLAGLAMAAPSMGGVLGQGILHGLKLVAVAIVAQAVWGMARTLCPDRPRAGIAVAAVGLLAILPGAVGMLVVIVAAAAAGMVFLRGAAGPAGSPLPVTVTRRAGLIALSLFAALLVLLPLFAAGQSAVLAITDAFYRAGALVFGGGHVVLPLLEAEVVAPGWVSADSFLAGYGAAQAVPGPLFTFAAWLGALIQPGPGGLAGAAIALCALFLPGFLLLVAALPFWSALRARAGARALMQGANAAVVGILAAALYTPVFTGAVQGMADFALALAGFVLLTLWKAPPWGVVALAILTGALRGVWG